MGRGPSRWGPQQGASAIEFVAPDEQAFLDASASWGGGSTPDQQRFEGDRNASRGITTVMAVLTALILAAGTIAAVQITARNDRSPTADARIPIHERNTSYDDSGGGGGDDAPGRAGRLGSRPMFVEPPETGRFPVNPWVMEVPSDANPIGYTLAEPPASAPGWFELWAGPRAGRTVGRWLAVQVVPGQPAAPPATATAAEIAGRTVFEWTSRDGVAQLQFAPADGWSARLTAFGWSVDDLQDLAATMSVADGHPAYTDPDPRSDEIVVARPTSNLGFETEFIGSTVTSAVQWRTDDGRTVTLTVATAQRDASTLDDFVLTTAAGSPLSGPGVRREVGSFDAAAGRFPGLGDHNVVRWTIGSDAIALTGDLPVDELLELATTARPATGTEWMAIYEQVQLGSDSAAASADELDPQ